jgi:transposase
MKIYPGVIGIDVSKHSLDIFDGSIGTSVRIDNQEAAIGTLIASWADSDALVVFEATGRYDGQLRCALQAASIRFARVNPARARAFAAALGLLAKTDAIDARMLAAMGQTLELAAEPQRDEARCKLASLHKRRDQLVAIRKQERTRLAEGDDAWRHNIERHVAWLSAEIEIIERQCTELLAANADLDRLHRLLRTIPGVGPVTAATLIALLPELGSRSPKTIAALAGLAPFNVDSGIFRGQRMIRGGRKRVRDALYMAAVTAARSKSRFKTFLKNLTAKGKPNKLALIALARKILITANAVARDQVAFQP